MADDDESRSFPTRVRPWLFGVVIVCGLAGLYYFLATRGPRAPGVSTPEVASTDESALRTLSAEVDRLENDWREADARGAGNSLEARASLASAVEKQRERVRRDARATPAESDRLRALERHMADLDARQLLERIARLEREADAARIQDRTADAVVKMREAAALLAELNRSEASASLKELSRETRLRLDIERLEAEPLSERLAVARKKAEAAAAEGRWDDLRTAYEEARAAQARINREYPHSPFADPAAEEKMEDEIQSLQAAALAVTVRDNTTVGDENARAGYFAEAGRHFALAKEAQDRINTQFPQSRQYSAAASEDIEARRQTVLSAEGIARLKELDAGAAESLRARDLDAAGKKIAEAAALARTLWRDFSRSRELDAGLRERVDYRASKAAVLASVQEAVFSHLKNVTGAEGAVRLSTIETPQALYALVMATNPSRKIGDTLAVDSVNWMEAQTFCRQLGWLLGRTVRLPSEAIYRAARAGKKRGEFRDLSGGVAEWLDASAEESSAPVAGGSYLDAPDFLATFPIQSMAKTARARHVGFRVIVE